MLHSSLGFQVAYCLFFHDNVIVVSQSEEGKLVEISKGQTI